MWACLQAGHLQPVSVRAHILCKVVATRLVDNLTTYATPAQSSSCSRGTAICMHAEASRLCELSMCPSRA